MFRTLYRISIVFVSRFLTTVFGIAIFFFFFFFFTEHIEVKSVIRRGLVSQF